MRIISQFKDYYDGVTKQGLDGRITFRRISEGLDARGQSGADESLKAVTSMLPVAGGIHGPAGDDFSLTPFMVGFCGKLYAGLAVEHRQGEETDRACVYSAGQYAAFCERLTEKRTAAPTGNLNRFVKSTDLGAFLKKYQADTSVSSELHAGRIVVALYLATRRRTPRIIINPRLEDLEFFRVFDASQAFQEIEMYLGGILAPEEAPTVAIADKDRIQQHGFDRWSFRRAPTLRKPR